MRRQIFAVASAVAFAASTLVVSTATQAQAAHSCMPESPCYPHICVELKPKPRYYFCNG